MEVYCRKNIGENTFLEYKMVCRKENNDEFGDIATYGIRAKYIAPDDFQYMSIDDVAQKPQLIMQIIKYLFDLGAMPDDIFEQIKIFLSSVKTA